MSSDYLPLCLAARASGSARFPAKETFEDIPVGRIAKKVRAKYLAGELTDREARRFESLPGWVWVVSPAAAKVGEHLFAQNSWAQHYAALAAHLKTGPLDLDLADADLYVWVERVRERYWAQQLNRMEYAVLQSTPRWEWGHHQKTLPVNLRSISQGARRRCAMLRAAARAGHWERRTHRHLSALEAWAMRYGHVNVPVHRRLGGLPVGRWVAKMRRDYHFGKLSDAQVARLEAFKQWSWRRKSG